MFSDIVPVHAPTTENWAAIITAIAGALGLLLKKRFARRPPHPPVAKPDLITRTEFHQSLDTIRDRVDTHHHEVLTTITDQGAATEHRLDRLTSTLARIDKRTKH